MHMCTRVFVNKYIYIYIYKDGCCRSKEKIPQENKLMIKMEEMIKEVHENLEDIKENQKRL